MRGNINGLIELTRPILAQTMTYLIKMTEPCSGIFKGGRVIFKDHGEFIIKEVINDQNFTIYLIKETLPEEVQVTHIDVKMKDSFQKIGPLLIRRNPHPRCGAKFPENNGALVSGWDGGRWQRSAFLFPQFT